MTGPRRCLTCNAEMAPRKNEGPKMFSGRKYCSHRCSRALTDPAPRFWSKVEQVGECWEWQGVRTRNGHGRFKGTAPTMVYAHRWAYEHLVGPIPEGLVLDHLCVNPPCVNPWHLDPVPVGVNTLRGNSPTAVNRRKLRCINGHEFTPENTRTVDGVRWCRTCDRERRKRYRAERKGAA